jgi:hypothetical protein
MKEQKIAENPEEFFKMYTGQKSEIEKDNV